MKTKYFFLNLIKEYNSKTESNIKICNCGNYCPFVKNGSCRFCYGYK